MAGRKPASSGEERIFVQIAAYRDSECIPTVADLFAKASLPERITVGICWQYDAAKGESPLSLDAYGNRVKILNFPAADSQGAGWAKSKAQSLWAGEEYVLQIDGHSRFAPKWDELLIEQLENCDSKNPVVSVSPPGYLPPNNVKFDAPLCYTRPSKFSDAGILKLQREPFLKNPEKPVETPFASPRFLFSRSNIVKAIPVDPHIYFEEEEITLSVRLWTNGFDIFTPTRNLVFHLYNNEGKFRPYHWKDNQNWENMRRKARARYKHIVGIADNPEHEYLENIEKYGSGAARSIEKYEQFAGISLNGLGALKNADDSDFIKELRKYSEVPKYWLEAAKEIPERRAKKVRTSLKITTSLSPLTIGDFVPFFETRDKNDVVRAIELYAGRPIFLFFLPNNEKFIKKFVAIRDGLLEKFKPEDAYFITIMNVSGGELGSIIEKHGLITATWSDASGAVFKMFDVNPDECSAFALSRNIKVMKRYEGGVEKILSSISDDLPLLLGEERRQIVRMHAPVMLIPDAIPKSLCDEIITYWNGGKKYKGTLGIGKDQKVNTKVKKRTDVDITDMEFIRRIDEKLTKSVLPEIKKVGNFDVTYREKYKIGCYFGHEQGHYNQHRDTSTLPVANRRYSMSLCLNDDFEGGGLVFTEYSNDLYRLKTGGAIVFPSTIMHKVEPVTSGVRFIMVTFMYGDKEARFKSHYLRQMGKADNVEESRILCSGKFDGIEESRVFTQLIED